MNLNAKWTTFTALAIAALGTGVLAVGCSSSDDSGVVLTTNDGTGGDNTGTGTGDTGPTTCNIDDSIFAEDTPAACIACLSANCCAELQGCLNVVPESGADLSCKDYWACVNACNDNPVDLVTGEAVTVDTCITNSCDSLTNSSVIDAYEAVGQCSTDTTCDAVCGN